MCINIAFHFDSGWECGQIGRKVDSSKHTESFKQIYESDVQYPSRGGTVFHRLQLDLYGVGTRRPRNWYLGWCCPGQCHLSVSRKEKTSSGSCVRGHLMDFLSRRDRFLYYTRRFLTYTRHILTRISWFCVGSARLYMILWDSVWFLVGLKKK